MNVFRFSESQVQVLKNFATIFPTLTIYPDKTEVINALGTVLGTYKFSEPLPIDITFGIHDLNEFLAIVAVYKSPEITLHEKFLIMTDDKSKVKFLTMPVKMVPPALVKKKYSATDIITRLDEIGTELEFKMTSENLTMLMKMAGHLKAQYIFFSSDTNGIKVTAGTNLDNRDNSWDTIITESVISNRLDKPIKFAISELRIMILDYDIRISSAHMSQWTNSFGVDYFIGCQTDES